MNAAYAEKWNAAHRAYKNEWHREYRQRIRHDAIVAYGGKCVDCGTRNESKLEFDHVDGGGNTDRDKIFGYGHRSPGGWNFYLYLKRRGFPSDAKIVLRCTACHNLKHPNRQPKAERRGSPAMQNPQEFKQERDLLDPVPF